MRPPRPAMGLALLVVAIIVSACDSPRAKSGTPQMVDPAVPADLRTLLPAYWLRTQRPDDRSEPASPATLHEFERALGRPVPPDLAWFWSQTNGIYLDGGNTQLHSVSKSIQRTLEARSSGRLPDEAVEIGGDGSDSIFVLWAPRCAENGAEETHRHVVLQVLDMSWEQGLIRPAGDDLPSLLWCRHAYYGWMYYSDGRTSERRVTQQDLESIHAPSPAALGTNPLTEEHFQALQSLVTARFPPVPSGGWSTETLRQAFGTSEIPNP